MKIMFFIPTMQSGGAERVISVLSNHFAKMEHQVVICSINDYGCCYELDGRVKLESLKCQTFLNKSTAKRMKLRHELIKNAVLNHKPDVLVSFMSDTNIDVCLALKKVKVPLIVSERNDPKIDPASKLKRLLRKFAYKRADGFVFQTEDAKRYFDRKIQNKSKVILNPLTENICEPYMGERLAKVVAVGRLNAQKNYPLLINAFEKFSKTFPNYTLEVYGKGALEERLNALIAEKGLSGKVILKGYSANVHESIKDAEFYIMSSDFEGMPNALMEAMALGLPCISTDCPCGGPKMMIKSGENGILVPVKDEEALLNAMTLFAENKQYAKRLGENAAKIRERVEAGKITASWIDYIQKIMADN